MMGREYLTVYKSEDLVEPVGSFSYEVSFEGVRVAICTAVSELSGTGVLLSKLKVCDLHKDQGLESLLLHLVMGRAKVMRKDELVVPEWMMSSVQLIALGFVADLTDRGWKLKLLI